MPNPVIFYSPNKIKTRSGKEIEISPEKIHGSCINSIMESDSKDLKEINYRFPGKILNIFKQKIEGIYITPEYKRSEIIAQIKIEDILKIRK